MLRRSGFSEPRKRGAADRIPGTPVSGEARTEEPAAARGEDRKEKSGSQCGLVKEARKKEGALTFWR